MEWDVSQRGRQLFHATFSARQLLEQGEVGSRLAELLLKDLPRVVEQRSPAVENGLADAGAQRAAASQLGEVHSHSTRDGESLDALLRALVRHERPALREGQGLRRQWRQATAQGAVVGQQGLHLGDVGAAEDQLEPGRVALLLHHRLDAGEAFAPRFLPARKQVGELVDDDQDALIGGEAVESAEQSRQVGQVGPGRKVRLERIREAAHLLAWRPLVRHQDLRGPAIGEGAEQPRLSDASPAIEGQRVAVIAPPPIFKAFQVAFSVEELVANRPSVRWGFHSIIQISIN